MRTTDVENTSPPEVDPQAFTSLATSLFGSHRPYSDAKVFNLSCLDILPVQAVLVRVPLRLSPTRGRTAFCTEPYISSFQGASYLPRAFLGGLKIRRVARLLGFRVSVHDNFTTVRNLTL